MRHMVALYERRQHDGDLRTPVPIGRGSDGEPPGNDPEHQPDCHCRTRRWRDSKNAQMANAANANVSPNRSAGNGKFEK